MSKKPTTSSDLKADEYTIGQAAKILEVSTRTMVRWDEAGRLKSLRTATNRRYYKRQQLIEFAASKG